MEEDACGVGGGNEVEAGNRVVDVYDTDMRPVEEFLRGNDLGARKPVMLKDGSQLYLEPLQILFVQEYMSVGDVKEAARAVEVPIDEVTGWLKDRRYFRYLKESLQRKLKAEQVTLDYLDAHLHDSLSGKHNMSKYEANAMSIAYKRIALFREKSSKAKKVEDFQIKTAEEQA